MSDTACSRCGAQMAPGFSICPACGHDGSLENSATNREPPFAGRYRRLAHLGEGGMGAVYEAEDLETGDRVALKLLLNYDSGSLARLRREARAMAQVAHPNAARLLDMAADPQVKEPYIVMELLSGRTLSAMFRDETPFEAARIRTILAQLLDVLAAAHGAGVIHRDLTPRNIIVDEKNGDRVKVCDFGIAKVLDATDLTRSGLMLGTLGYMAPEQIRGRPVDARTDLYAVGVLLYRMLAGRLPFESALRAAVLYQQAHNAPVPPHQIRDDVDRPLDALCMRALSTEPVDRPTSAQEMLELLSDTA